jgi:2-polyprenyl-3-methyl-5-hydroxy-6-metoxy-1,4-benzoquinol methylase
MDKVNTTELGYKIEHLGWARNQIHRDYIAHCLRWQYVLRHVKRGMNIIDIGCGSFPLLKALYSNKLKPNLYVGIDIRKAEIEKLMQFKTNFTVIGCQIDIRVNPLPSIRNITFSTDRTDGWNNYDIAVCLEVVEHFEAEYITHVLNQIRRVLKPNGLLFLSTPNYDAKVGMAKAHIHEYTDEELKSYLRQFFTIEKAIGIFASQKDIELVLTRAEKEVYDELKPWFSPDILSTIFSSTHPYQSRNILWVCRKD